MAKKPKVDKRSWLPKRSSPFAREVDVALQLVSRAAAGVGKAPVAAVNLATQALVCDGLASEFEGDAVMAAESAESFAGCDAETRQAALALANELGATTPCVNAFVPPYPDPVATLETDEAGLAVALTRNVRAGLGPRTWVLSPVAEAEQPAISLSLLEYGRPVVCAIALPNLPRNSMSGEKLLRMTVSFDGQSGAVPPPMGSLMWAEQGIGAYERSVGGEHGTDVRIRVDRALIGRRDIVGTAWTRPDRDNGPLPVDKTTGVQDFGAEVIRCEAAAQPRAAALASELGISGEPLQAKGPFAYGLIARGEAMAYFDLPDAAEAFDRNVWAHAAGVLLVQEAGGRVTDPAGNELDFSVCREGTALPAHVVGAIATNGDIHANVMRKCGLASLNAALG